MADSRRPGAAFYRPPDKSLHHDRRGPGKLEIDLSLAVFKRCSRFKIQDSRFKIQDSRFKIQDEIPCKEGLPSAFAFRLSGKIPAGRRKSFKRLLFLAKVR